MKSVFPLSAQHGIYPEWELDKGHLPNGGTQLTFCKSFTVDPGVETFGTLAPG